MNAPVSLEQPTRVRYGVLGFCAALSMITYMDRACISIVMPDIQKEFGFSDSQRGWIFGAFTFAYAAFEVPTGWLGDRFGARNTLIRIVLWWSVFTVLTGLIYPTPTAPLIAFWALLTVRFFFGIGEAGAYPNIARAFHNWFPFGERGSAKGAVWMAGRFGGGITPVIVLALVSTELLADGSHVTHWRHTFWIFGAIGVVWCVFFWLWYRDRPEDKATVNQAEIDLIRKDGDHSTEKLIVPWKRVLTNPNLWFLCIMYSCASFGWYFNITYLPGFLEDNFHVTKGDKFSPEWWSFTLMAGLPLLVGAAACLFGGVLTDMFIRRTGNRKWGRRLFGIMGHGLCAVFYFGSMFFAFGKESPWMFIICIAIATFWNDMTMGAAWASCLDIGRRYSGIVAGCMNTIGNLGGFLANIVTGYVLNLYTAGINKKENLEGYLNASEPAWKINFSLYAGVYVIAVIMWTLFDSTKSVAGDAAPTAITEPH